MPRPIFLTGLCSLFIMLLLTTLGAGCTPRGLGHEAPSDPQEPFVSTARPPRIGVLGTIAPSHSRHVGSIDQHVASIVAGALGNATTLRTFTGTTALLDALRRGEIDVAVGVVWSTGSRLPVGLNAFSYERGDLRRVCAARGGRHAEGTGMESGWVEVVEALGAISPPLSAQNNDASTSAAHKTGTLDYPDCILAPARAAELWVRYMPAALAVSRSELGFNRYAVYSTSRPDLGRRLATVFSSRDMSELRHEIGHARFGFLEGLQRAHYEAFHHEVDERLPRFEPVFRAAAEQHRLDWRLLAAVSYQESHWKPLARSPTGVRGMMMLTRRTARELGVRNRLDPHESIWGGARYLRELMDELPSSVNDPNRTWLALAAYNMGMRGLSQAQEVARQQGLNPQSWAHLSRVLRRSADSKWREAASYVARVRDFEDIIRFRHQSQTPVRAEGPTPFELAPS